MASKNNKSTSAAPQLSNVALQAQVEQLTQEKANALQIANTAAQQLLYIENRFAPLLDKKFNWFNALFHIKEVVLLVKEIIAMIKEFRGRYMTTPVQQDDSAQ